MLLNLVGAHLIDILEGVVRTYAIEVLKERVIDSEQAILGDIG